VEGDNSSSDPAAVQSTLGGSAPTTAGGSVSSTTTLAAVSDSSTRDREPDDSLEPISGYGDFSNVEYAEVDWKRVVELQVECANDQGIPVTVMPPGDGISYDQVPRAQHQMASAILRACLDGLNLPPYEELSDQQLADLYDRLIETMHCLEEEGYSIEPPPSVDSFVEEYYGEEAWHPYSSVTHVDMEEWNRLNQVCPQPS